MSTELEVRQCHDRRGVEVSTPNDVLNLSIEDAERFIEQFSAALEVAKSTNHPAPSPLTFDGMENEFAYTTPCEAGRLCAISIGGFELGVPEAMHLRDWLVQAIAYHQEKGHCKESGGAE